METSSLRCVSAVLPMQHPAQSVMDGAGGEYVVHIIGMRAPAPGCATPAGSCTVRAVDAVEAARVAALALTRGGADTATIVTPRGTRRVLVASGGSADAARPANCAEAPRAHAHAATRKRARDAPGHDVHATSSVPGSRGSDAGLLRAASEAPAPTEQIVRVCARNSCDVCERRAPRDQRELALRWHPLSLRECRGQTQSCILLVADDAVCDGCWNRPGVQDMLKPGTSAAHASTIDGLWKRWRAHSRDKPTFTDTAESALHAAKTPRTAGAARTATQKSRPVVAPAVVRACHLRRHGPFFARPCVMA